jgi:hypothetical protein
MSGPSHDVPDGAAPPAPETTFEPFRRAGLRETTPGDVLSACLEMDRRTFDPAARLACELLATEAVRRAAESLRQMLLSAVTAGYVIGRQQIGAAGAPVSRPASADTRARAEELLQRERSYDFSQLRHALGPAVQSLHLELARQAAAGIGASAQDNAAEQLAYRGLATGLGLAAAEADLASTASVKPSAGEGGS